MHRPAHTPTNTPIRERNACHMACSDCSRLNFTAAASRISQLYRRVAELSCFAEHDPHHLISAARYSTAPIDLAGLILGARQAKHGPDCLGFPEASVTSTVAR